MTYTLSYSKQFDRQYGRLLRSGNERIIKEMRKVMDLLVECGSLPEKYRYHKLKGEFQDCFECHVLPDWLLIYRKYESILVLELIATGSHSELFE